LLRLCAQPDDRQTPRRSSSIFTKRQSCLRRRIGNEECFGVLHDQVWPGNVTCECFRRDITCHTLLMSQAFCRMNYIDELEVAFAIFVQDVPSQATNATNTFSTSTQTQQTPEPIHQPKPKYLLTLLWQPSSPIPPQPSFHTDPPFPPGSLGLSPINHISYHSPSLLPFGTTCQQLLLRRNLLPQHDEDALLSLPDIHIFRCFLAAGPAICASFATRAERACGAFGLTCDTCAEGAEEGFGEGGEASQWS
jgi:hypothetical protein